MPCPIDYRERDRALATSKYLLSKVQLEDLSHAPLLPICPPVDCSHLQLIKFYEASTYTPLPTSLNALLLGLHSLNTTFAYIIHTEGGHLSFYIGILAPQESDATIAFVKLLLNTPPFTPEIIPHSEALALLYTTLIGNSAYKGVSSTSLYAPATFDISLEQVIASVSDEPFTCLCLASPLSSDTRIALHQELLSLVSTFKTFKDITHTCSDTINDSINNASSHAHNNQKTTSHADTTSSALSQTASDSNTQSFNTTLKGTEQVPVTLSGSHTTSCTSNTTDTGTQSDNTSSQHTCMQSNSDSNTNSTTNAYTVKFIEVNENLNHLATIASALAALYETSIVGPCFDTATYFLGTTLTTSLQAASLYMAQFTLPELVYYPFYINTWTDADADFIPLKETLSAFTHPCFDIPHTTRCDTPALPWSIASLEKLLTDKEAITSS